MWAVAATTVAIIALIDGQDGASVEEATGDVAGEVSRMRRDLDSRLDRLERRIELLPRSEDVRRLDNRVSAAQDRASRASRQGRRVQERVDELERRLGDLAEAQERREREGGGGGGGGGTGGATAPDGGGGGGP